MPTYTVIELWLADISELLSNAGSLDGFNSFRKVTYAPQAGSTIIRRQNM